MSKRFYQQLAMYGGLVLMILFVAITLSTLNTIDINGERTLETAKIRVKIDGVETLIKNFVYNQDFSKPSINDITINSKDFIDQELLTLKIQLSQRKNELMLLNLILREWGTVKSLKNYDKVKMLYELDMLHRAIDRLALKEIQDKQIYEKENTMLLFKLGIGAGTLGFFLLLLTVYLGNKANEEKEAMIKKVRESERNAIEASKAKTMFLAMAGHELRTPLNGIIGLSELLRKSNLPDKATQFTDNIYQSGMSLLKVINNILEFAKIESGKINLEMSEFSVISIIQQIFMSLSIKAQKKNINLNYMIDKDVPLKVHGDASRLSQVIYNLLGNAIKFTAVGTVSLKIKVHSYDQSNGLALEFIVEDTGIGMNNEEQKKLFLPFNAIQTKGTKGEIGSGLGLAISSQIVNAMGGEIVVESATGKGSKFSFICYFPKFSKEKYSNIIEQKIEYNNEIDEIKTIFDKEYAPLILVVDDNPTNLLMGQAMLERLGARTVTATNGKEALYECSVNKVDLILMDCQMPVMDGFEATMELRKQKNSIPILAMTANTATEDQDKCFEAGMNGFIPKPISIKQLSSEFSKFLKNGQNTFSYEVINNLGDIIGKDGVTKVISTYLSELPKAQHLIDFNIKERNIDELHRIGHRNKSSSQTVGAKSLANLFKELEKVNEIDNAILINNKIKAESETVQANLSKHLTQLH